MIDALRRRLACGRAAGALLLALGGAAHGQGQTVALQGMMGGKALLIVGNNAPRMMAPGESVGGVKVISTAGDTAVVEIDGKRHTLRVGDAPASVGGSGPGARGSRIVLPVDRGGHFIAQGAINGKAVNFLVDTGASAVSMSMVDAERLGVNWRAGRQIGLSTANGVVAGYHVRLASVRIGDVEVFDIDGVISPQPMPYVLLGNSFLNRFQMKRDADQMVLERRY